MSEEWSEEPQEEPLECRVCRGDAEPDRPLVSPCLCSGSISYCHQSCLEEWLSFSQKTSCELCNTEYIFDPIYAENAPEYVPALKLVLLGIKKFFFVGLPRLLQLVVVVLFWTVVTPSLAAAVYKFFIKPDSWSPVWSEDSADSQDGLLWQLKKLMFRFGIDIVSGVNIISVVGVSFLVMISFADFLRLHWNEGRAAPGRRRRRPRRVGRQARRAEGADMARVAAVGPEGNVDRPQRDNIDLPPAENRAPHRVPAPEAVHLDHAPGHPEDENIDNDLGPADDFNDGGGHEEDVWEDVDEGEEEAAARVEDIRVAGPEGEGMLHENLDPQPPAVEEGPPAGIFFDDDGVLDEFEAMNAQGAGPEGVEVRIALNDIFGFQGPLTILLRSTGFLFIFVVCYVWTFGYIPLRIGSMYLPYLNSGSPVIQLLNKWLPEFITSFVAEFAETNRKSGHLISVDDAAVILMGYVSNCIMIFSLGAFAYYFQNKKFGIPLNATPKLFRYGLSMMSIAASILKVGTLLFLRIFWLPVIVGFMALFSANVLFEFTQTEFITFMVDNTVGCISVAWVAGISFMLVITLSILQLREVLHPDILARKVRPQEAHLELLNSLVSDGGLAHARRVTMSLIIYTTLVFVFLWLPMFLLRCMAGKFDIQVYYLVSNLQLPHEMALVHFVFISMLEKHKDMIGHFQYKWLVFACEKLNLTSFLLPVRAQNVQITSDGTAAADVPASELQVVLRPPPGWDGKQKNEGTTRWAFEDDAVKSEVENSLLPRQHPSFCFLRIIILALGSWILVLGSIIAAFVVVMWAGRSIGTELLLSVPQSMGVTVHDPLCFVIGAYAMLALIRTGKRFIVVLKNRNVLFKRIPLRGHLFLGFLIRRATQGCESDVDQLTVFKHDFMLGSVLVHTFVHLAVEGFLFTHMDNWLGTRLVAEYNQAMTLAALLFVTDASERADSGLVINGEGENVPLPKALFVPPYSVHEVQAIRMWDHIESEYLRPFLKKVLEAVLLVQLGYLLQHSPVIGDLASGANEAYVAQGIVVLHVLHLIAPLIYGYLSKKLSRLYNSIRDDMYLVGKELKNFDKPGIKGVTTAVTVN